MWRSARNHIVLLLNFASWVLPAANTTFAPYITKAFYKSVENKEEKKWNYFLFTWIHSAKNFEKYKKPFSFICQRKIISNFFIKTKKTYNYISKDEKTPEHQINQIMKIKVQFPSISLNWLNKFNQYYYSYIKLIFASRRSEFMILNFVEWWSDFDFHKEMCKFKVEILVKVSCDPQSVSVFSIYW